ncbi:MAG TPA: cytidine deaminase [Solirubrobacterales bacterium]|nr:cytidine deaminase [Solirubrobacterales bacterium]
MAEFTEEHRERLIAIAEAARGRAYAPYSRLTVGAALLAGGEVFSAVNVENSSLGLTICAERAAACRAVAEGQREFQAIVICAQPSTFRPCGACLQVLSEFSERGEMAVAFRRDGKITTRLLSDLLPLRYGVL